MGDHYHFYGRGNNSRSVRDDDFDEEDVWAVVKEKKDNSPKNRKPKDSPVSPVPRHIPSASRMIPGSQNAHNEGVRAVQQSAPVKIPDWSKIFGKKGPYSYGEGSWGGRADDYGHHDNGDDNDGDEDEDEDEDCRLPPHEWIAKKLARSQISSFSVCEGAGRTLKGRDLSQVRNAVLTRTGFLE